MGRFINPYGGGVAEYDGKWQPHWGVDIVPFAESGCVAVLINANMSFKISATSKVNVVYSLYGAGDTLVNQQAIDSTVVYSYSPNQYSGEYPEVNNQGYGVFVLKICPSIGYTLTLLNMNMNDKSYSGALWMVTNFAGNIDCGISSSIYPQLEMIDLTLGGISRNSFARGNIGLHEAIVRTIYGAAFYGATNIRLIENLGSYNASSGNLFSNCYLLRKVTGFDSLTNNT